MNADLIFERGQISGLALQTMGKIAVVVHGKISAFGAMANRNRIDSRRNKQGILMAMYHLIEVGARNISLALQTASINKIQQME
jgi:hypothetical protein